MNRETLNLLSVYAFMAACFFTGIATGLLFSSYTRFPALFAYVGLGAGIALTGLAAILRSQAGD